MVFCYSVYCILPMFIATKIKNSMLIRVSISVNYCVLRKKLLRVLIYTDKNEKISKLKCLPLKFKLCFSITSCLLSLRYSKKGGLGFFGFEGNCNLLITDFWANPMLWDSKTEFAHLRKNKFVFYYRH